MPHAEERKFFYGANFEFSINAKHWDPKRFTSEIRPIIGWHLKPIDIIVNPILDTSYDGFGNLDFAPSFQMGHPLPFVLADELGADFARVEIVQGDADLRVPLPDLLRRLRSGDPGQQQRVGPDRADADDCREVSGMLAPFVIDLTKIPAPRSPSSS